MTSTDASVDMIATDSSTFVHTWRRLEQYIPTITKICITLVRNGGQTSSDMFRGYKWTNKKVMKINSHV